MEYNGFPIHVFNKHINELDASRMRNGGYVVGLDSKGNRAVAQCQRKFNKRKQRFYNHSVYNYFNMQGPRVTKWVLDIVDGKQA